MSPLYWAQRVPTGLRVEKTMRCGARWTVVGADGWLARGAGWSERSGTEDPDVARGRTGPDRYVGLARLRLLDGLHTDRHSPRN